MRLKDNDLKLKSVEWFSVDSGLRKWIDAVLLGTRRHQSFVEGNGKEISRFFLQIFLK